MQHIRTKHRCLIIPSNVLCALKIFIGTFDVTRDVIDHSLINCNKLICRVTENFFHIVTEESEEVMEF